MLEHSFSGPVSVTEEIQGMRRRILSVAVAHLGLTEKPQEISTDPIQALPWRAIQYEWNSAVVPGYKLVFHMIRELLPSFDIPLLRETLEFVLTVCGTPYSTPFVEKLCELLRSIALLSKQNASSSQMTSLRSFRFRCAAECDFTKLNRDFR